MFSLYAVGLKPRGWWSGSRWLCLAESEAEARSLAKTDGFDPAPDAKLDIKRLLTRVVCMPKGL